MWGDSSALFRLSLVLVTVVCVHGSKQPLIFLFAVEVHPGSQEYGQYHPPAQTVQPVPISDCSDQLEVCRGPAQGMPQQGELWLLVNVCSFPWRPRGDHIWALTALPWL